MAMEVRCTQCSLEILGRPRLERSNSRSVRPTLRGIAKRVQSAHPSPSALPPFSHLTHGIPARPGSNPTTGGGTRGASAVNNDQQYNGIFSSAATCSWGSPATQQSRGSQGSQRVQRKIIVSPGGESPSLGHAPPGRLERAERRYGTRWSAAFTVVWSGLIHCDTPPGKPIRTQRRDQHVHARAYARVARAPEINPLPQCTRSGANRTSGHGPTGEPVGLGHLAPHSPTGPRDYFFFFGFGSSAEKRNKSRHTHHPMTCGLVTAGRFRPTISLDGASSRRQTERQARTGKNRRERRDEDDGWLMHVWRQSSSQGRPPPRAPR